MNILGYSGLHGSVPFKKQQFPDMTPRDYRIAQGYDSAAALLAGGKVLAAAGEERFTREKATGTFPIHAIDYCLQAGGIQPEDIDIVAHGFSYEPFRDAFQHDPFTQALYANVYDPQLQQGCLDEFYPDTGWSKKFVPVQHHLAHAASAFYPSGFEESLVLVTDGMGEVHSMTALVGSAKGFEIIRQVSASHSLGIMYGAFTLYLGFMMGMDEYKVMGLAPYGNPRVHFDKVMSFVNLQPDGTYTIPLLAENKTVEEKETHAGVLRKLCETFGPQREPEGEMTQDHKDLAAALQAVLQSCQLHLLKALRKETGLSSLCLAGGVALNCTSNGIVRRSRLFDDVFVQPASGDDGAALGAALYVQHEREPTTPRVRMTVPLWGPEFSEEEIAAALKGREEVTFQAYDNFSALAADVADRIAEGQIIAWFQGRMEYGPRALGSRSILADPRGKDMRDRINWLVKKREGFRPFAPAVAEEEAATYFDIKPGDERTYEHMLFVMQVKKAYQEELPAITHVDGSARAQSVNKERNPTFYQLIHEVGKRTGMASVLNTSFNVRGQPIVCTPEEAIDTFIFAGLDALAMGNHLVLLKEAPVPVETISSTTGSESV